MRDDLESAQKKSAIFEAECARLRDVVATAQQNVVVLEKSVGKEGITPTMSVRTSALGPRSRDVSRMTGMAWSTPDTELITATSLSGSPA